MEVTSEESIIKCSQIEIQEKKKQLEKDKSTLSIEMVICTTDGSLSDNKTSNKNRT
jgi:hypothetical protein